MPSNPYTVVSLFSGALGLDLGLERTRRFNLLACIENDAAACETIRRNRDAGRLNNQRMAVYERDICTLDPEKVLFECGLQPGKLDVLIGGPPCQSFSTAGNRGTVQDHRGTLLWQFLRFIEIMRPKFFLMENVRGLLSSALRHRPIKERPEHGGAALAIDEQPGSVVRQFAADLGEMATPYRMDCFEVNAVNYGAPQLRERAIFVGNRYNAVVDFPQPTHGAPEEAMDRAPLLFATDGTKLLPWRTLRAAIGDVGDSCPKVMDFSPRKKKYLAMVPPGSNWRSLPVTMQKESMGPVFNAKGGRSGWWRRLSYDLPCPTLVTMPNHAGTSLCHPAELRALSVMEYQLIQEFPRDWVVCGRLTQQYAQIGNAVPVRLGEVAGNAVAAGLDALSERRWQPYARNTERYRVIYVQSHIRTRRWFKDGNAAVWEDGMTNGHAEYGSPKTRRKTRSLI